MATNKFESVLLLVSVIVLGCSSPVQKINQPESATPEPQPIAPAIPTGLAVSNATVNSLMITWNPVSTADTYQLYRDLAYDGTYDHEVYSGDQLSFIDPSLAEYTRYHYKVRATNAIGSSGKSISVSGRTLLNTTSPPIPQNLTLSNVDTTSLRVSWDSVSEATSYELYRATGSSTFYLRIYQGPETAFDDTGLASGQTYGYKVRSARSVYYSAYSDTVSVRTLGPPVAPSSVLVSEPTTTSLKVSWSPVADATGYRVYRSDYGGGYDLFYDEVYDGTSTVYEDTGLRTGWKYAYRVSAYNTYGEGPRTARKLLSTLDGEVALQLTYDGIESKTYYDADVVAYRGADSHFTSIATWLYDSENQYLGSDFLLLFHGTWTGVRTGSGASLTYGFSRIESTSCTVNVLAYGDVGQRITGAFSAELENGKSVSGTFSALRGPDS